MQFPTLPPFIGGKESSHLLGLENQVRGRENIHPSLLPSFGGDGMYGNHVHKAVIEYGCKVSGCTVHFCDEYYDNGPIIIQRQCPVFDDDTIDTLARRVFEEECIAYPEAIALAMASRLKVVDRRVFRTSLEY